LRIFPHPTTFPVGLLRFFSLLFTHRYNTFIAACSLGKCPRWRTALRNRAFNDSIALVAGMKSVCALDQRLQRIYDLWWSGFGVFRRNS
jgi:hypothetical protein